MKIAQAVPKVFSAGFMTEKKSTSIAQATPMMAQYFSIKERSGDALLFYRMGDFYELFFDDAEAAAPVLDIALTQRGQHGGAPIPMCGVPFHSYEAYLAKLIRAGFKVAICEQMESPDEAKKRGSKSVVKRDIVRTVTPGTILEDTLLDARSSNFLAAVNACDKTDPVAVAWADISTGDVYVRETDWRSLTADIAEIAPMEILAPEDRIQDWSAFLEGVVGDGAVSFAPLQSFDAAVGQRRLLDAYSVASLDAFGEFSRMECGALGALVSYISLTQAGRHVALSPPKRSRASQVMAIDAVTRASLELLETQRGGRKGSLISAVDRTITGPGARALAKRLAAPLTCPDAVNQRLNVVDYFLRRNECREETRRLLKEAPDIARAVSRLTLGRGGPRDLSAIGNGLVAARNIASCLSGETDGPPPALLSNQTQALENREGAGFAALIRRLCEAIDDNPPLLARDGNFIARGFDPGLDSVRMLRDESRRVIAGLEARYREIVGVKALKIRHNNVLGYFVETPPAHGDKLMSSPLDQTFIHRQTLASAVRFTTTELSELDAKITRARDESIARELEIFDTLVAEIAEERDALIACADALAEIDAASGLAELAAEQHYSRPVVDASMAFVIEQGRHPVVSQQSGEPFVPNDCALNNNDDAFLWLITGPNMAGKSTFLRQNALIAILAQAGSFVPAARARIGIVDRIFSRVGASDDISKGRSTFMVEMVETAAILNQSTKRSLVVLDEIGRGTSTFDGLSIAWAAVEHLHNVNCCRALFATHYHELTALSDQLSRLENMSMKVREWKGDVVFLHEIARGPADRSYGVAVAKLAGLPAPVIKRAEEILTLLEAHRSAHGSIDELPLFAAAERTTRAREKPSSAPDALNRALRALEPDKMSPRDALDALYRLKSLLE